MTKQVAALSDKDLAEHYNQELRLALGKVCDIMRDAHINGIRIGFNLQTNEETHEISIAALTMTKQLVP